MIRGRFAPSPSGRMHLGNAAVAVLAWASAKSRGGEVVLRIEDLDPARSRAAYAQAIMEDLLWLGLPWDRRAADQSRRGEAYRAALAQLKVRLPMPGRAESLNAAVACAVMAYDVLRRRLEK